MKEAIERIKGIDEQIKQLEAKREEIKRSALPRWRARLGEAYYSAGSSAMRFTEYYNEADDSNWAQGNYFKTKEEASAEINRRIKATREKDEEKQC